MAGIVVQGHAGRRRPAPGRRRRRRLPREFCFDPGRDTVKPALAAVLDKVTQSLRRTPTAELHLIAAPSDANGSATLGVQRATRVYDYLRAHGIPAGRLAKPSAASGAAVQLRMEIPSPA